MKFNEALLILNAAVVQEYPNAAFYEAQGHLVPVESTGVKVDGTIDKTRFRAVYDNYGRNQSIFATFNDDDSVHIEVVDSPWLEDIHTTPFPAIKIEDAIEILVAKYGEDVLQGGPVTLRHQLFPGEAEPRYFFGNLFDLHTVNVFTGKVDVPAGGSEPKIVKKKSLILKVWEAMHWT